jgi:hypothetical protein
MRLLDIRKDIHIDISLLPDWINTKSLEDNDLWNLFYDTQMIILNLIVNKIYSDEAISNAVKKTNRYINRMCQVNDDEEKLLKVWLSLENLIDKSIEICIVHEYYEAAANLKNFEEKLINLDNE